MSSWLPVVLYAAGVFYLSSVSHPSVPSFRYSDKFFHLLLYAGLGFLVARAWRPNRRGWSFRRTIFFSALVAFLYGMSDELHQFFVPGRSPELADLVADGVGGVLGSFLYEIITNVQCFDRLRKI